VELRTQEHIDTAAYNRDLARSLLIPAVAPGLPKPPYEWATVIAFYSAVHLVNAFLWERYRVGPRNHAERGHYVRTDPVLRRCAQAYARLLDVGFKSRYVRRYQIEPARANRLINFDLATVESVVMATI
jgi:hypothetical protein